MRRAIIFLILAAAVLLCPGYLCYPAQTSTPGGLDYSFMWWAYGFTGQKVLNIQTDRYGVSIDVAKAALRTLGPIAAPLPYEQAVSQDNDVVFGLPKADLALKLEVGGATYTCDQMDRPARIINSGRYFQRADVSVGFVDSKGGRLEATGRLEIAAWPDRLAFILEVTPQKDMKAAKISMELTGDAIPTPVKEQSKPADWRQKETYQLWLAWTPDNSPQNPSLKVTAAEMDPKKAAVSVEYDAVQGWYKLALPGKGFDIVKEPDHMDRYALQLQNLTEKVQVFRLMFEMKNVPSITGLSPMLRDSEGYPTGIAVQISKNWHGGQDKYGGSWFNGFAMLHLGPRQTWTGEFDIAYARWGGVPAASHAQLCLIGWPGGTQLWDQAAIGSWGESICYDPEIGLNRSMIDDVRPLMVWGMGNEPKIKWGWTENVGGGDFLVYYDKRNLKQKLTRLKTAYLQYGPNLTEVVYSGISADGCIAARIAVSSPRSDDINRAYHLVRYDVLKDTEFARLAFYQLGADNYNENPFNLMARGNADKGLLEEWEPKKGGLTYSRESIACEGAMPWFSLHKAVPGPSHSKAGAWADRGMIIRSWKARIGGQEVPTPYASVFGTNNGVPSANVEISPPPKTTQLKKGDFVEFEVELVILPMSAENYYGPNENLRADLSKNADTWKPVFRQAAVNNIDVRVTKGKLVSKYPLVIEVDGQGYAEYTVTGGLAYLPVTFRGVKTSSNIAFARKNADGKFVGIDQSVYGKDFWQASYDPARKCWDITYNVPMDAKSDARQTSNFIFGPARK